jgi:hypothetical protein
LIESTGKGVATIDNEPSFLLNPACRGVAGKNKQDLTRRHNVPAVLVRADAAHQPAHLRCRDKE